MSSRDYRRGATMRAGCRAPPSTHVPGSPCCSNPPSTDVTQVSLIQLSTKPHLGLRMCPCCPLSTKARLPPGNPRFRRQHNAVNEEEVRGHPPSTREGFVDKVDGLAPRRANARHSERLAFSSERGTSTPLWYSSKAVLELIQRNAEGVVIPA